MDREPVPPLSDFLRWISEMPAPFRGEPEDFVKSGVRVRAVVADLLETICGAPPEPKLLEFFEAADKKSKSERNRLRWVLAGAHLLWHPAFRSMSAQDSANILRFLIQDLDALAKLVNANSLATDEERREELARLALRSLNMRLPGEGEAEAEDRFKQVDSVERVRVMKEAAEREKRAREVREALARAAAEEAASKATRE